MTYTRDDVQVLDTPLAFIRGHAQMFLDPVCGVELAMKLVRAILLLTRAPVTVSCESGWWLVAAEVDWLTLPGSPSADDVFARMMPFPQAGANSIRPEVLVTAFATGAATWAGTKARVVKGDTTVLEKIGPVVAAHSLWKRVVAFRLES